ncbi:hypothetical protein ADM96_15705 [Burkholderia sp. ST111]|nr:hypothetical protein ADM96_15705 [Burkholderia sp. ST111]
MLYDEILRKLKAEAADHGLSREEMERLAAEMAEPEEAPKAEETPQAVDGELEIYFFFGPEESRRKVAALRECGVPWDVLCDDFPWFVMPIEPSSVKGHR